MFDSRIQSTAEGTNSSQETSDQNSRFTVSDVTQFLSEIQDKLDDPKLRRALTDVVPCITDLEISNSD